MNEIDQLEQELSMLRHRFAQSLEVLDHLAQVRQGFDTLSERYQILQGAIEQAKAFLDTASPHTLEPRLVQIETNVDVRYEQLQAQLTNLRFDFEAVVRQLREEVEHEHQELSALKQQNAPSGLEDGTRLKWIESSLQHLNSTVYSDRTVLQKLDRRVSTLKRTIDIIAVIGFVGFLILGLLVFTLR